MEDTKYHQSSGENNRIKKKEDKYFCQKCHKRYKSELSFSAHLRFACVKEEEEEKVQFKHPSCIQLRKRPDPRNSPSKNKIKSSFRKLAPNTCFSCGKSFDREYGLARHISKGCLNYLYKCPYCDYQENTLLVAFFHVIKQHPGLKVYLINKIKGKEITVDRKMETYLCSVPIFRHPQVQNSSGTSKKPSNTGSKSNKKSTNRESKTQLKKSTKQDKKTQEQDLTKTIECPKKCGKFFSKPTSIDHHLRIFCPEVKRYQCAYCEDSYASFKLTATHVENEHTQETICAISISTKTKIYRNPQEKSKPQEPLANKRKRNDSSNLPENSSKKRKISESSDQKENSETKSEENESSKLSGNSIKKSELKKTNGKKVICSNGCGKLFALNHHMKSHAKFCGLPKRFQCPYCPIICKVSSDVTMHINRQHQGMENYFVDVLCGDSKNSISPSAINDDQEAIKSKEASLVYEKRKLHLKCPKCNSIYDHPDDLWDHFKKCSKNESPNPTVTDSPAKPLNDIEFINIPEPQNLSQLPEIMGESNDLSYLDILEGPVEIDETLIDIANDSDSDEELGSKELTEEALNEEVSNFVRMEADNQSTSKGNTSDPSLPQFVCPNNCGCKFTKQTTLKIHLSLCCQKPIRFKCPYCEYYTHEESNGFNHSEKFHSSEEISLIDLITRREIYPKMKEVTIDDDEIECVDISSDCEDESEQNTKSTEAKKTNHNSTVSFRCRYCSFLSRSLEEGYAHMMMKHVNKNTTVIRVASPIDDEIQIID